MRKLLISVLIVILLAVAGYMCYNGITIINYRISGLKEIKKLNENLDERISVASKLVSTDYPTQISNISKSMKDLKSEKEKYDNMVTISTDEQVQAAAKIEKYEIEYLWTKIGNWAKKEGVTMKIDLKNSSTGTQGLYNLQFTVNGQYIGIADFIYDIENDTSLGFKIEEFKLLPGDKIEESKLLPGKDTNILTGSFVCKDISINIDSSNVTYSSTPSTTDTTTNSTTENNETTTNNSTNTQTTNTTNSTANTTGTTSK